MRIIGLIPCSKEKIWDIHPEIGAVPASRAYRSAFHLLARDYALKHADSHLIISAKYGLMDPGMIIPGSYDVTFSRPEDPFVNSEKLHAQAKALCPFDRLIVLCPRDYADRVDAAFSGLGVELVHPLRGVGGWGCMHKWLRERI